LALGDEIDEYRTLMIRASAAVLVSVRNEYKLTQEDVAKGLRISVPTVYRIEAGAREMTIPEMGLLARLVKTSPAEILDLIQHWAHSRRKKRTSAELTTPRPRASR